MNLFSPAEVVDNYAVTGKKKAELPGIRLLLLGVLFLGGTEKRGQ